MAKRTKDLVDPELLMTHAVILTDRAPAVISTPVNWRLFEWEVERPLFPLMSNQEIIDHEREVLSPGDSRIDSSTILSPRFLSGLRFLVSTQISIRASVERSVCYMPEEHEILLFPYAQAEEPVWNACRCLFLSYASAIRDWACVYAFDRVVGELVKLGSVRTALLLDRYPGFELYKLPSELQITAGALRDMPKRLHGVMDEVVTPVASVTAKEREAMAQFIGWDRLLGERLNVRERLHLGRVFSNAASVDPEGWDGGHPTRDTLRAIAAWRGPSDTVEANHAKTREHLERCVLCSRLLLGMALPYFTAEDMT